MIPDEVYEALHALGDACAKILEVAERAFELAFESFEKIVDEIHAPFAPKVVHDTPYTPKCKLGKMFRRIIKPRARSCC